MNIFIAVFLGYIAVGFLYQLGKASAYDKLFKIIDDLIIEVKRDAESNASSENKLKSLLDNNHVVEDDKIHILELSKNLSLLESKISLLESITEKLQKNVRNKNI